MECPSHGHFPVIPSRMPTKWAFPAVPSGAPPHGLFLLCPLGPDHMGIFLLCPLGPRHMDIFLQCLLWPHYMDNPLLTKTLTPLPLLESSLFPRAPPSSSSAAFSTCSTHLSSSTRLRVTMELPALSTFTTKVTPGCQDTPLTRLGPHYVERDVSL